MDDSVFEGKTILVTGGTGSVGSALVKRLLNHNPATIRILDVDETKQFEMMHRLRNDAVLRFFLGDIRDKERLYRAFENVDIIFHCAALKHVLWCEYNPFEAVKTNVLGTQNVIDVALDAEVERVIFTSSDKAVNPMNVMGTTKLLCERLITAANYYKGKRKTVLASVRFGNVFGSRGSVVPLFRKQIERGGPVTVTDPDMTRFVMTPEQTVKLVFKATEMAHGGEVFILKMPAVRIADLAIAMVQRYGKGRHIETRMTGILAGEKKHEELMTAEESTRALETPDMFLLPPEMKELLNIRETHKYNGNKTANVGLYSSKDAEQLPSHKIAELLASVEKKPKEK